MQINRTVHNSTRGAQVENVVSFVFGALFVVGGLAGVAGAALLAVSGVWQLAAITPFAGSIAYLGVRLAVASARLFLGRPASLALLPRLRRR